MITIIENIITAIVGYISAIFFLVVAFFLTLFLVFIPTNLLDPKAQISNIENDLCIKFPEKYLVLEKYEDFLAFEEHQEMTFQFEEDDFNNLLNQVNSNDCASGKWIMKDSTYTFTISEGFVDRNEYFFEGTLSKDDKTLKYKFSNL